MHQNIIFYHENTFLFIFNAIYETKIIEAMYLLP